MFLLVQTGDKSGEVTARMNLSDLRMVVGLKSNANIHTNIFCTIGTNSSALTSFQGYPNFSGKSTFFRKVFIYVYCRKCFLRNMLALILLRDLFICRMKLGK